VSPKQNDLNILKQLKETKVTYKVNISECPSNNIKLYTERDELFYCEEPICSKTCILKEHYSCIKGNDQVNSPLYNICPCENGWKGDLCNEKVFYDIRYI